MLISAKKLHDYQLQAIDSEVGAIDDLLFDDQTWQIRFLVARLQKMLPWSEKVLINPQYLCQPENQNGIINVNLSEKSIRQCPPLSTNLPVSQCEKERAFKAYRYADYWSAQGLGSTVPRSTPLVDDIRQIDDNNSTGEKTHLRSCRAVNGYHIHTVDGGIGHVDDFIIDAEQWRCTYLLVNTRNWLSGGQDVLVSLDAVDNISWHKHQVRLTSSSEAIERAPHFDIAKLNKPLGAQELESSVLPRAS